MIEFALEKLHAAISEHRSNKWQSRPVFLSILEMTSMLRIQDYLHLLQESRDSILENEIQSKALFLMSQVSGGGTVNYLPRSKDTPYPDDIDDTCSALFALSSYNKDLITSSHLAHVICTLESIRSTEISYTFNTWCTDIHIDRNKDWISIDPVAQSAVVAFFEYWNIPCPELKHFVYEKLISFDDSTSDFYHMFSLPAYLTSRIHFNNHEQEKIIDSILIHTADNSLNQTEKHLGIAALCNLQKQNFTPYPPAKIKSLIDNMIAPLSSKTAIAKIFSGINPDPLYIESISQSGEGEDIEYANSLYFGQLIYIEALLGSLYLHNTPRKNMNSPLPLNPFEDEIIDSARQFIESIIDEIYPTQASKNPHSVLLRSYTSSLIISTDFKIFVDLYTETAVHGKDFLFDRQKHELVDIHLLGLLTYLIYDKLIDGDIEINILPGLMHLHKTFILRLQKLLEDKNIGEENISLICSTLKQTDIFNTLLPGPDKDKADADQIAILSSLARIPLADHHQKSLGSAIIPIILLENQSELIKDFFTYFQLARQIADDMEDFEKDILKGKLTTAYYFLDLDAFTGANIADCPFNMNQAFDTILSYCQSARFILTNASFNDRACKTTVNVLSRYLHTFENQVKQRRFEYSIIQEICFNKTMKTSCFQEHP